MTRILLVVLITSLLGPANAQNVGIGTSTPHSSALLDLNSTTRGFLPPRMTTAQRTAIAGAAVGLMVYDTDLSAPVYFSASGWQVLSGNSGAGFWITSSGNNIINTNTGRIGIGASNPLARFAIDSGLVVDQSNSNNPGLAGRNNGIFFGSPALAGIASSKVDGSGLRSGLSFFTNGIRRMAIDSLGRIGIATEPAPNYQLTIVGTSVSSPGNVYISDFLNVGGMYNRNDVLIGDRLAVNSFGLGSAALRIKGRTGTPDSWGQHIMLVSATTSDSAAILYDGDGMKLRTFDAGDGFFFRNSSNQTTLRVFEDGNVSAAGEITSVGRGVVLAHDANSHQIRYITTNFASGFGFNIASGISVSLGVAYNLGFTGAPFAFGAQLVGCNVLLGDITRVVLNLISTTSTLATFEIINVGNTSVACSGCQIKMALVGPR